MIGYINNLQKQTLDNNLFRKVIYTGKHTQLVLMCLNEGEDIGEEVHENVDQFFRFEQGKAKVKINGQEFEVEDDFAVIIPAGTKHNIINIGKGCLKLYTLYSPPNHPEGTIHPTKQNALVAEINHDKT